MDFDLPEELTAYLSALDAFIDERIRPLEQVNDNIRFFDHRREYARTDWENHGLPTPEWEALLAKTVRVADEAGHFRYQLPEAYGGKDGSNLSMAVIREHLAAKGLGLHCDLQTEHAIVGNNVGLLLMLAHGTEEQKARWADDLAVRRAHFATAITEPEHGSDATFMETRAVKDGEYWVLTGTKTWNTGIHSAERDIVYARTSGEPGAAKGITAFLVDPKAPGFSIDEYLWTFNMPADHARITLDGVRVHESEVFGEVGKGLQLLQHFVNENRIRQAASSLGAAQYCINESVAHAKARKPFGRPLADNQGIQFPLVELHTQAAMLRTFIRETAWRMDRYGAFSVSDRVSMANYWANRLVCQAADQAIQVHGGMGYSRHLPFEHIYRHHRRYRITEGAEEIQMRRVAGMLFGYMDRTAPKGVA